MLWENGTESGQSWHVIWSENAVYCYPIFILSFLIFSNWTPKLPSNKDLSPLQPDVPTWLDSVQWDVNKMLCTTSWLSGEGEGCALSCFCWLAWRCHGRMEASWQDGGSHLDHRWKLFVEEAEPQGGRNLGSEDLKEARAQLKRRMTSLLSSITWRPLNIC